MNAVAEAPVQNGQASYKPKESIQQMINKDVAKSAGLSAIPIPFVDTIGTFYLQYNLINKLADHYGVNREEGNLNLTVTGGLAAVNYVVKSLFTSVLRDTKVEKMLSETMVSAALATITTTAVGEIFSMHFRRGGDLRSMDMQLIEDYLRIQMNSDRLTVNAITNKLVSNIKL